MAYIPKILAFAGSTRRASHNKRVVQIAAAGARDAGAEVTFLDLKDLPMPIYDADAQEAEGFHPNAAEFQRILLAHDGLIVSTPEYNGSLPGVLKNAFDWASRANGDIKMGATFRGKVAAIMAASPGGFGGIQCLSHLRDVLSVMGVIVLPEQFAVPTVHTAINETGVFADEKMQNLISRHGANAAEMIKKIKSL